MKFKLFFITIALTGILLTNCKKDDDNNPGNNDTTKISDTSFFTKTFVINASSHSTWAYFSFAKGDTVKITEPGNSLDWDIAFERYMVKTNGGKSGIGQCEAFKSAVKGQTGFDNLKLVPDSAVYMPDDTVVVYGYNPANPSVPTINKYILNEPLYNWYTIKPGTSSTLVPVDNIYIVKTAKGKYVKLWIQSYYSDIDAKAGYIKILYSYQGRGTKTFE